MLGSRVRLRNPIGEKQLSSVVNPVPVIMDLETEKVTVIDLLKMDDISG